MQAWLMVSCSAPIPCLVSGSVLGRAYEFEDFLVFLVVALYHGKKLFLGAGPRFRRPGPPIILASSGFLITLFISTPRRSMIAFGVLAGANAPIHPSIA